LGQGLALRADRPASERPQKHLRLQLHAHASDDIDAQPEQVLNFVPTVDLLRMMGWGTKRSVDDPSLAANFGAVLVAGGNPDARNRWVCRPPQSSCAGGPSCMDSAPRRQGRQRRRQSSETPAIEPSRSRDCTAAWRSGARIPWRHRRRSPDRPSSQQLTPMEATGRKAHRVAVYRTSMGRFTLPAFWRDQRVPNIAPYRGTVRSPRHRPKLVLDRMRDPLAGVCHVGQIRPLRDSHSGGPSR
jgi:hypothetical protein